MRVFEKHDTPGLPTRLGIRSGGGDSGDSLAMVALVRTSFGGLCSGGCVSSPASGGVLVVGDVGGDPLGPSSLIDSRALLVVAPTPSSTAPGEFDRGRRG